MNAPQKNIAVNNTSEKVWIAGGSFNMGSNHHYPEESPQYLATVEGFWMDCCAVTNEQYAKFVKATGYLTQAERDLSDRESLGVVQQMRSAGSIVFIGSKERIILDDPSKWWVFEKGANWRHPDGSDSSLEGRSHDPVVHVSLLDALEFARWKGDDLPTEAEWEYAALGGKSGLDEWPWGNNLEFDNVPMANTWHGEFPWRNDGCAGYKGRAPSKSFPKNEYGLYNMIGNVWEWTRDRFQIQNFESKTCCSIKEPNSISATSVAPEIVIKGGSYLCASNYCRRYRASARTSQQINTATGHIGFRCVHRSN